MAAHLTVEQHESMERLSQELIREWRDILDSVGSDIPFSDPDWLHLWIKHFGSGCRQLIITAHCGGDLVGVLPLVESRHAFWRQITFMGWPQATHANPVVRPGYEDDVAGATASFLRQMKGTVFYRFAGLNGTSDFENKFAEKIRDAYRNYLETKTICPVIYPDGRSYEEYYRQRINRNNRNQDKRCLKRLSLLGTLEFHSLSVLDMVKAAEIHRGRWKKKLDTSGFVKQEATAFYTDLLCASPARWSVLTLGAYLDKELIAFEYGYRCGNQALLYRSAHNDLLCSYAPGKATHREIFRRCFGLGLQKINLGIGYEDFKKEWTAEFETVTSFEFPKDDPLSRSVFLFSLLKGRLRNRLKQSRQIVLFKRNTLGCVKYFFSVENCRRAYSEKRESIRRLGFFGYWSSFVRTAPREYWLDLTNYRAAEDMKGSSDHPEPSSSRMAALSDVPEVAYYMNCDPKKIVRRFFRQEQCCVLVKDQAILCLCWIDLNSGRPRLYDCRFYRERCREEDAFRMFADILALLQKQEYAKVHLELERGNKAAAAAAGKVGFQCAKPQSP